MSESAKSLDKSYLLLARQWAEARSKAVRKKVGAIIVSDNGQIISDGYNGTPAGADNCCEHEVDGQLVTKPDVIHAELNAILKMSRWGGQGTDGATIYQTLSPCPECSVLIRQAGIKRVVYIEDYRDQRGVEDLRSAGIIVDKLDPDED